MGKKPKQEQEKRECERGMGREKLRKAMIDASIREAELLIQKFEKNGK